jgi:hypothetical protein
VSLGSGVWAASLAAACSLLGAGAPAQTTGTLGLGVSTVHYDGFLPSGAVTVSPAVEWEGPIAALGASGTYLRFESGHRSLQGAVTVRLFTPPLAQRWRGEVGVATGASQYLDFETFWHAVAMARLDLLGPERDAWIGVTAGTTSYGAAPRSVTAASTGVRWHLSDFTLHLSATRSRIGDTTFTDVRSSAYAERGSVVVDATLGARVSNGDDGTGMYGAASAAISLGERTALVLGGGRYPTDPISGSLAASYLTVALALRVGTTRRHVYRAPSARGPSAEESPSTPAVRLDVYAERGGPVRLRLHVPDAARVELAGDFTDWDPIPLTRVDRGTWEATLPIASGVHRVNVRIDGGAWIVPAGVTRLIDDFDGEVGIFAVP